MLDDPELTDYFDSRGAMMTQFPKEEDLQLLLLLQLLDGETKPENENEKILSSPQTQDHHPGHIIHRQKVLIGIVVLVVMILDHYHYLDLQVLIILLLPLQKGKEEVVNWLILVNLVHSISEIWLFWKDKIKMLLID